jgi:hypothetical protein
LIDRSERLFVGHRRDFPLRKHRAIGRGGKNRCKACLFCAFRSGQTRERIPSNAWARKIAAPTKPITAVIVSNIANVLYATAREKTAATLHSQKISGAPTHIPIDRGFCATGVIDSGNNLIVSGEKQAASYSTTLRAARQRANSSMRTKRGEIALRLPSHHRPHDMVSAGLAPVQKI